MVGPIWLDLGVYINSCAYFYAFLGFYDMNGFNRVSTPKTNKYAHRRRLGDS